MDTKTLLITPAPLNCNVQGASIRLASGETERFLNLFVKENYQSRRDAYICMPAQDARKLRDMLVAIYPFPAPVSAPAPTTPAPTVTKRRPKGAQTYLGNGSHTWEPVIGKTFRLRVPGGWLYKTSGGLESTTVFVPMPNAVGYVV